MEHNIARALNYLHELCGEGLDSAQVAKHRSAISSLWGPLPQFGHAWLGKTDLMQKFMKAIREQEVHTVLEAPSDEDGRPNGSAGECISIVLEEDIIQGSLAGPSNEDIPLRLLAGRLATLLTIGSKRRPSCLTRIIRQGVSWTDDVLRGTIQGPKESAKSKKKTRSLICERLSDDPRADVVRVYEAYVARAPSGTATVLVQCTKKKTPAPATVRHWIRAYMEQLGYSSDDAITPYMLIKSVTTAQLQEGQPPEKVSEHRWDSSATMMRHYDLRGEKLRVLRPNPDKAWKN